MKTKLMTSAARPMFGTGMNLMVRGPAVAYDPDEEAGGEAQETAEAPEGDTGADGAGGGDEAGGEASGEPTAPAETAPAATEAEEEPDPPKTRVPWQKKRIDALTAQKTSIEQENAQLKRDLEAARANADPLATGGQPLTLAEEEINRRAARIAAANTLNDRVNTMIYDVAIKADPTFESRIPALREACGAELAGRPDFFEALTKVEGGAAVMNALTKDLDHLSELLEMSPVDMGIEIAKMSAKLSKPKDASISRNGSSSPPPEPVRGTAVAELALDDPRLPMEDYAKRRAAEREARRAGSI